MAPDRVGCPHLAEIGAQAFVQAWLKLSWNPFVLDQIEMLIGGTLPSPIDQLNALIKRPRWVSKINKGKGKGP
jgi:hypothetical protein